MDFADTARRQRAAGQVLFHVTGRGQCRRDQELSDRSLRSLRSTPYRPRRGGDEIQGRAWRPRAGQQVREAKMHRFKHPAVFALALLAIAAPAAADEFSTSIMRPPPV